MLANDTRNQHFLTRVEQKLNALNPQAAVRNLRIPTSRMLYPRLPTILIDDREGSWLKSWCGCGA